MVNSWNNPKNSSVGNVSTNILEVTFRTYLLPVEGEEGAYSQQSMLFLLYLCFDILINKLKLIYCIYIFYVSLFFYISTLVNKIDSDSDSDSI